MTLDKQFNLFELDSYPVKMTGLLGEVKVCVWGGGHRRKGRLETG